MNQKEGRTPTPKVPKEFFAIDRRDSLHFVGHALGLWLLPLMGIGLTLAIQPPLYGAIPVIAALAFLAGNGFHLLGLVGHDGAHYSLHRSRYRSTQIGVWISSLVPFHFEVGFAASHAEHHRFTNGDKDPDRKLFRQFETFWSRLLFARLAASQKYFRDTVLLVFNRWPDDRRIYLNLSMEQLRRLARQNLLAQMLSIVAYGAVALWSPLFAVVGLGLSYVFAVGISGLRPYIEHAGLGADRTHNSRSWISPLFRFLFGGVSYHQAHHLYPGIQSAKLAQFHAWATQEGVLDQQAPIVTNLRQVLRVVDGRAQYAEPNARTLDYNPQSLGVPS